MAHLQKFTRGSVKAILEHDTRTAQHDYKNHMRTTALFTIAELP